MSLHGEPPGITESRGTQAKTGAIGKFTCWLLRFLAFIPCQPLECWQPSQPHPPVGGSRRVLLARLTSLRGKTERFHIWVSPNNRPMPTTWQLMSTADQLQPHAQSLQQPSGQPHINTKSEGPVWGPLTTFEGNSLHREKKILISSGWTISGSKKQELVTL